MSNELTLEEAKVRIEVLNKQLRTCEITGLGNLKSFEEDEKLGWSTVVAIELVNLHGMQNSIGHAAAERFLMLVGSSILKLSEGKNTFRIYYRYGDEFAARFKNRDEVDPFMALLKAALQSLDVGFTMDGRRPNHKGGNIEYAKSNNYWAAYKVLRALVSVNRQP